MLLLALGVGGFLVWRWLFPPDEVVIRRLVQEAVAVANWEEQGGMIQRVSAAGQLGRLCAPDVVMLLEARGVNSRRVQGREDLKQMYLLARSQWPWLRLTVDGAEVVVADSGQEATVLLAATVRMDQLREPLLIDYELGFRKIDNDWLLARVEPVKGFGM